MRRAIIVLAGLAVVVAALLWLRRTRPAFATPDACVDGLYEAAVAADADAYVACLSDPLRATTQRAYPQAGELHSFLRATTRDLKGWALVVAPEIDGPRAVVHIEERRLRDRKRVRFRLVQSDGAWSIDEISAAEDLPAIIPYGTHEKELLPKS